MARSASAGSSTTTAATRSNACRTRSVSSGGFAPEGVEVDVHGRTVSPSRNVHTRSVSPVPCVPPPSPRSRRPRRRRTAARAPRSIRPRSVSCRRRRRAAAAHAEAEQALRRAQLRAGGPVERSCAFALLRPTSDATEPAMPAWAAARHNNAGARKTRRSFSATRCGVTWRGAWNRTEQPDERRSCSHHIRLAEPPRPLYATFVTCAGRAVIRRVGEAAGGDDARGPGDQVKPQTQRETTVKARGGGEPQIADRTVARDLVRDRLWDAAQVNRVVRDDARNCGRDRSRTRRRSPRAGSRARDDECGKARCRAALRCCRWRRSTATTRRSLRRHSCGARR